MLSPGRFCLNICRFDVFASTFSVLILPSDGGPKAKDEAEVKATAKDKAKERTGTANMSIQCHVDFVDSNFDIEIGAF